jgi:hypothetical protein
MECGVEMSFKAAFGGYVSGVFQLTAKTPKNHEQDSLAFLFGDGSGVESHLNITQTF